MVFYYTLMAKKVLAVSIIIIIIIIVALLLLITLVQQNSSNDTTGLFVLSFAGEKVQRSLSSPVAPDSNLTVILSVELDDETSIYGVQETFPSEFILVNAGVGTSDGNNSIRWFDFEATPGETINLTYTITSPSIEGNYIFIGEYLLENDENVSNIGGTTSIIVSEIPAPACNNGEEKCEGQTSFICSANVWVSQGLVSGKCGYTSGGTGGTGSIGGTGGTVIIPPPAGTNTDDLILPPPVVTTQCGDLKCNGDETCKSCWIDCGKCFAPENIQKIAEGDVEGTVFDIDTISDYGQDYTSYIYFGGALVSFIALMGIFRLIRIRKGNPPSTIDWKKISTGIKKG